MNRSMHRRVVITGCGVVSAAGNDLASFWQGVLSGTSFIRPLRGFSFPELPDARGGEVELGPEDDLPSTCDHDPYRSRCLLLVRAATRRALSDAGLSERSPVHREMGVVFGTTLGEERQVGDLNERCSQQGTDGVDAGFLGRVNNARLATSIASEHGLGGPVMVNATACSSGNAALAWAFDLIRSDQADCMLAGGVDTLTRLAYCGFSRMGALSKSVCRPFDVQRDGVSFGEGAGVLVLEELDHARRRGARIYAEITGYGASNDAHHLTAPEQTGGGFARAIRQALETSGLRPEQVEYVCAHGTGTRYNDLGESSAMRAVFGERASEIPISSIKGAIGHTNGAASAIEALACALALVDQRVPPTTGLREPDPELGLDFIAGQARKLPLRACLNLAAGFGGFNVCLVLEEAP